MSLYEQVDLFREGFNKEQERRRAIEVERGRLDWDMDRPTQALAAPKCSDCGVAGQECYLEKYEGATERPGDCELRKRELKERDLMPERNWY